MALLTTSEDNMNKADLVNALASFDDDYEVHIVLSEDDGVYEDIINIEGDGVDAIEITVS